MKKKLSRKEQFLLDHPRCFACGAKSVEWDHLPSQACFDERKFPEDFEFPVCRPCNGMTSNDEQTVALLSRSWSDPKAPAISAEVQRYMSGVANNQTDLFRTMMFDVYERDGDLLMVGEGPGVKDVFSRVLPKWARAFHYLETREILPPGQKIYGTRFAVPQAMNKQVHPYFLSLPERPLRRAGVDFKPQFSFSRKLGDGFETYTVLFRRAFGAWMIIDRKGVFSGPGADQFRLADFVQ